jgi:hypothetical protein
MLKIAAVAVTLTTTVTPALTADQLEGTGDAILSIGEWGKVLNQTVFACRLPADLETHGSLMIEMNTLQIAKGQPVKASPDGACWPLAQGTEVQFVRTAEATRDVTCIRRRDEQDCSWVFRLGIVPGAIYDREQADTKGFIDRSNEYFDRVHPECKEWRETLARSD